MRSLYFDCFSGISGNMILGALLDAGLEEKILLAELEKLGLKGYKININKFTSKGITGTQVIVDTEEDHHHRGIKEIFKILDKSSLDNTVVERSKLIFMNLAEVEAKIHNKEVDEIHFHEVGAIDSIVDIVGGVIGISKLGIEKIYSSKVHVGTGSLKCAHGILPVPAPATLELLKNVPVYSTGIQSELVTPTGAAFLTVLAESFGALPDFTIKETGFGMGTKELPIPNFLRVVVGEENEQKPTDTVQLIETNIDDMNPQYYDYVMDLLFAGGAKDVYLNPIIMKKNRPGVILSVIADAELSDKLIEIILNETTTLGVRISAVKKREILNREVITVETSLGKARVKVKRIKNGKSIITPEYDDCKKLAREKSLPISDVSEKIKKEAETIINQNNS